MDRNGNQHTNETKEHVNVAKKSQLSAKLIHNYSIVVSASFADR